MIPYLQLYEYFCQAPLGFKEPLGLILGQPPRRGDIWGAHILGGRLAHDPAEEREGVAASDFLDVRVGVPPLDQTTDDVFAIRR